MKKTIEKKAQNLSFWEQLKATPDQIKMFFVGVLVVVAAIAFVLPNVNVKTLQGNILNVAKPTKWYGYGYWYGYGTTTVYGYGVCKMTCTPTQQAEIKDLALLGWYGYGYGYGLDGKTGYFSFSIKNVGTTPLRPDFKKLSNIVMINYSSTAQQYWLDANFMNDLYSNIVINPGQIYNVEGKIKLDGEKLTNTSHVNFTLGSSEETNTNNNSIQIYLNQKPSGNTVCQSPENVLACSLGLDNCPVECRSTTCQTPENVLLCSLRLSDCPMQCRPISCQTSEMTMACSLGLDSCPQECRYGSGGVTHSEQIVNAFRFAVSNNMATSNDINEMYNAITKTDMMNIMFAFQKNVLKREPIAAWFSPGDGLVTRAVFGTYLSRILWGTTYDGGNPFYVNHLNALKDAKIITSISNPEAEEVKGYMYIILQKVAESWIWQTGTNTETSYRTEWLNRDTPSGNGDYETYKDFVPVPCKDGYSPTNVEFVRLDWKTNQKVHISTAGGYCLNSENSEGCVNYKIKFYCEKSGKKTTLVEQPKEIPSPIVERPKVTETTPLVEKPRTVESAIVLEKKDKTPIKTSPSIDNDKTTTAELTILDIFKSLLK